MIPEIKRHPIKAWLARHKGRIVFAVALLLIVGAGAGLLWLLQTPLPSHFAEETIIPPKPKPKFYSPLTGIEVADEATTKRPVTAIMIENSPDARPQSGLKDAGVVFETIAEGGITRFVALYQEAQPALIGPVRSVRPYYIEWAYPFDPSVAHIGGSSRALDMIRSGKYGVDLDQFFNAGSYWRAADRYAPHNVYTSFDKLNALNAAKGHTTSTFSAWPRRNEAPSKTPNATQINIMVSTGSYTTHYDYDAATNSYLRSEGGAPHMDREGGRLAPKVVIALKDPISIGFEDGYREQINTSGSGDALIFQDGTVTQATWHKTDPASQIHFVGADGKDIPLVRGQTWITALDPSREVSWK